MKIRLLLVSLFLMIFASLPLLGQDAPAVEFFGGYSYGHFSGGGFNGWRVDIAKGIRRQLSVVAEGSGHYASQGFSYNVTTGGAAAGINSTSSFSASARIHTFQVGPRYKLQTNLSRLTPFVQVLGGIGRASGGFLATESQSGFGTTVSGQASGNQSITGWSISGGGGLDFKLRGLTLRLPQLDFQTIHGNGDSTSGMRLGVGIVFRSK